MHRRRRSAMQRFGMPVAAGLATGFFVDRLDPSTKALLRQHIALLILLPVVLVFIAALARELFRRRKA